MFGSAQTHASAAPSIFQMRSDTPYTRTFRRAIDMLGGVQQLAKALGVAAADVEGWSSGVAIPPPGVFLQAIDIVARAGFGTLPSKT